MVGEGWLVIEEIKRELRLIEIICSKFKETSLPYIARLRILGKLKTAGMEEVYD